MQSSVQTAERRHTETPRLLPFAGQTGGRPVPQRGSAMAHSLWGWSRHARAAESHQRSRIIRVQKLYAALHLLFALGIEDAYLIVEERLFETG